jgi:hypothetical protein
LAVIVEGASIVREFQGIYTNVLTYRRHCDTCGYLAPTVSTIVSLLSQDASFDIAEAKFSRPLFAGNSSGCIKRRPFKDTAAIRYPPDARARGD